MHLFLFAGRIYRLKIPSLQYLASLPVYDASNPTKDWGFPQLSIKNHIEKLRKSDLQSESGSLEGPGIWKDKSLPLMKLSPSKKVNNAAFCVSTVHRLKYFGIVDTC